MLGKDPLVFVLFLLGKYIHIHMHIRMTNLKQGASPVAQLVKSLPAMRETWVRFLGWEDPIPWRRDRLPTPVF